MKTKLIRSRGQIALQLQDAMPGDDFLSLVAYMTHYTGSAYWVVYDIRLSPYDSLSPYADLEARRLRCQLKPKNDEEREQAVAHLKEYQEAEDGTLHWSTFDGIVHGVSVIPGEEPLLGRLHAPAIYMSYAEALATLQTIRASWDAYAGDPEEFRIRNPYYQPDRHELIQLLDRQPREAPSDGYRF